MFDLFKNTINYVLSPSVCIVCDKLIEFYSINEFKTNNINLTNISQHLCKSCYYNIPLISNHYETKTTILKNIKVDELYVDNFYSLIDNKLDDRYIQLIYELKYHKRQIVSQTIGKLITQMLFNSINQDIINTYKYLIPVPLHYARLRERGFNQSLLIAEEISKNTKIPINLIINRNKNNQTQTKLSKVERKINISDIFKVNRNDKINFDKISLTNELDRVLIIDDVLTTGATVNSIAKELSNLGFKNIDVATLLKA